jgi:hypothetical protein
MVMPGRPPRAALVQSKQASQAAQAVSTQPPLTALRDDAHYSVLAGVAHLVHAALDLQVINEAVWQGD